jgi:hypothetical protein
MASRSGPLKVHIVGRSGLDERIELLEMVGVSRRGVCLLVVECCVARVVLMLSRYIKVP